MFNNIFLLIFLDFRHDNIGIHHNHTYHIDNEHSQMKKSFHTYYTRNLHNILDATDEDEFRMVDMVLDKDLDLVDMVLDKDLDLVDMVLDKDLVLVDMVLDTELGPG